MRRVVYFALAIAAALTSAYPTPSAAQTDGSDGSSRVDRSAVNALTRMGNYLRGLKSFGVKANVTSEDVLDDGQKVQVASRIEAVADKPNKLRVQLSSDRKQRMFFYDGSNFTIYAPRQNFYATVPAPSTIRDLVADLEQKYGLDLPFVDLFRWGTPDARTSDIVAAVDVGPSEVEGTTCEQYAFRQDGLDWQVWIQDGDFPLPRKLVLTTLTDEARPQYSATYAWNLAPSFEQESFVFTPPRDAKKITLAQVDAMRQANKRETGNNK